MSLYFSINSKIYFDNKGTGGQDAEAIVDSVKGKSVNYLQSKETKVVQLTTIQTAYLFANDTLILAKSINSSISDKNSTFSLAPDFIIASI